MVFKGKLITSERYDATKSLRGGLFLVLTISYILIGRRGNGLIGTDSILSVLIMIVMVVSGILLIYTYFYSRRANVHGTIGIEPGTITINHGKTKNEYRVQLVKNIQIEHNSYVGEDYKNQKYPSNYFGKNFISFTNNDDVVKFEFSIDSHYMSNKLRQLVDTWQAEGIEVSYKQV